jgi:hypothetical protein
LNHLTTDQLTPEFNDKRLRIEFVDGTSEEILVAMVSNSHCHDECDGIVYEVLSSNRPGWKKTDTTFWTEMKFIKSFTPIVDQGS